MTDHREIVRKEKPDLSTITSLAGKTALVTGANSPDSIGWHIAYTLACKGAKVYIGARSASKAAAAIRLMVAQSSAKLSTETVKAFVADISNFGEVESAVESFVAHEDRLDILVNNAAVLARPLDKDEHGISTSFATNHLGPFLLTTALLPLLLRTAAISPDVRIVNVSSSALFDVPPTARFDSLAALNQDMGAADGVVPNYLRYGYSKLANLLFTKALARRFAVSGVSVLPVAVHPGGVATKGAAAYLGSRDVEDFKISLSPVDGAITPIFAAAHPEIREKEAEYRAAFLWPFGARKDVPAWMEDEGLAEELWGTCERVLQDVLGE